MENISTLKSVDDLSRLTEVGLESLEEVLKCPDDLYRVHFEKDTRGKLRKFCTPREPLYSIQKKVNQNLLQKIPLPPCMHGSVKGCSLVTNAEPHICKSYIAKFDIADCFPSIKPWMVRKAFVRLGFSLQIARILTRLTTYRGELPQGAPTSPSVANNVLSGLATRLSRLCDIHNVDCTVYLDDITISGGKRVIKIRSLVRRIVRQEGFKVKEKKSEIAPREDEQIVTGVKVNDGLDLPNAKEEEIETLLAQCALNGPDSVIYKGQAIGKRVLRGKVAFAQQVNRGKGQTFLNRFKRIDWDV